MNWSAWLAGNSNSLSPCKFNKEEHENAQFLLRAYPNLQIANLEEEARKEGADPRILSALINGHSEFSPKTG